MAKRKKKDQPLLPPLAEGEWVAMPEKLEAVLVAELVPYADNARTHSPKQIRALQASIREFGFVSPVIIDAGRNILAGHGRVLAAQALGLETVPCVYAEHLTEAQRRAYILGVGGTGGAGDGRQPHWLCAGGTHIQAGEEAHTGEQHQE